MPETPASMLERVRSIAAAAAAEILEVYGDFAGGSVDIDLKSDNSPLTEADRRAHRLICRELRAHFPELPVLSEESEEIPLATRRVWSNYWLVDPLDGTKEFINRNGEFTVNIALIEDGVPVAGVVHVPVSGVSYCAAGGVASCFRGETAIAEPLQSQQMAADRAARIVASRRHRGEHIERLLALIEQHYGAPEVVSMGSSLKMCLLAEGKADLYPRLAPTSEWDTAAAHAVLRAAGGEIVDLQWQPLRYNQKDNILNPYFIAIADTSFPWRKLVDATFSE